MAQSIILTLDAGTTGVKCAAFDRAGEAQFSCVEAYPTYFPRAGWAQQKPQEQLDAADRYAEALGLAFQTRDDMLDVLGDSGKMGKATGMDENKNTFVRLYGVGACSRLIERETQKAIEALGAFEDSDFLKELSMKLAIREC